MQVAEKTTVKNLWDTCWKPVYDYVAMAPPVTIHPDASPSIYVLASQPLFLDGDTYTDPVQGPLGDCGLISGESEVALRAPEVIRNAFTDNGDGTWWFKYYDLQRQPHTILVDRWLPSPAYASWTYELWPALIEKAYAAIGGYLQNGVASYATVAYTYPGELFEFLTGQQWTYLADDETDFANYFAAGYELCLLTGTPQNPAIVADHAYAVIDYSPMTHLITLRNPWGSDITIPFSEVQADFQSMQGMHIVLPPPNAMMTRSTKSRLFQMAIR